MVVIGDKIISPEIFTERYLGCYLQPDGYNDLSFFEIIGIAEKPYHRYGWSFG